jgi:peptide/nickel transport system ATP-binding protein
LPLPEQIFNRYPHQLSGGQKQRVMIAMAMCCNPSLLICDEPTTALDVTVQKTILELIKEIQQEENIGVLFITHDLGIVAEIADRVAIIYKGEILEQDKTQLLFKDPKHPYTKALLACRPALHPKE